MSSYTDNVLLFAIDYSAPWQEVQQLLRRRKALKAELVAIEERLDALSGSPFDRAFTQ